jgi:hypothetical protein
MIVIEGPDLVGKTTMAKRLADMTGLHYMHYSRLPDSHDRYWDYLPDVKASLILDRFVMSEPVYAAMRGEPTPLKPIDLIALQREMINVGCVTVLLTAENDLIEGRWREGEMYKQDQVFAANALFRQIGETGRLPDFDFHIDMWFHGTPDQPFPGDDFIGYVDDLHKRMMARAAYMKGTREYPKPARIEA